MATRPISRVRATSKPYLSDDVYVVTKPVTRRRTARPTTRDTLTEEKMFMNTVLKSDLKEYEAMYRRTGDPVYLERAVRVENLIAQSQKDIRNRERRKATVSLSKKLDRRERGHRYNPEYYWRF